MGETMNEDVIVRHVVGNYLQPALSNNQTLIQVHVRKVKLELGLLNSIVSIPRVLKGKHFRGVAGMSPTTVLGCEDSEYAIVVFDLPPNMMKPAPLDEETVTDAFELD